MDYCTRCGKWRRLDPYTKWCDVCYAKWWAEMAA